MERIPAGNVDFYVETREGARDGGPSIQVKATIDDSDVQLLRFDCFRGRPHYHYAPTGFGAGYDIDPTLVSDSLAWVITQLGTNLGPMLERAGHPALAETVDPAAVAGALREVKEHFHATVVEVGGVGGKPQESWGRSQ